MDAAIVDGYQSGLPVETRPFDRIGEQLGTDGDEALERVRRLVDLGIVRRFGAVLNPPVIGSSTLAAVEAPEERFAKVAAVVNGYRQVNHNYARDHEWNMWFVVTAGSRETRDRILTEIEAQTGCRVLDLPMLTDYYIDLEFPVVNADRFARESLADRTDATATRISEEATGISPRSTPISCSRFRTAFPLGDPVRRDRRRTRSRRRPGARGDFPPAGQRLSQAHRLRDRPRRHRVRRNCMVVWDVPDDELDERGERAGQLPSVTLCYHRPRRSNLEWPYNLFTMIHGRDAAAVDAKIDELASEHLPVEHERLYSTKTLKQTGARYDEILSS